MMLDVKIMGVVMLPTDEETNLFWRPLHGLFHSVGVNPQTGHSINSEVKGQYLYIVSNSTIKKGDWVIVNNHKIGDRLARVEEIVSSVVHKYEFFDKDLLEDQFYEEFQYWNIGHSKKIEATTNPSLGIIQKAYSNEGEIEILNKTPKIPQSFIIEYVSSDGVIKEVSVVGERVMLLDENDKYYQSYKLKRTVDNLIIIRPAATYNRRDVINLLQSFYINSCNTGFDFNEWVEQNV